MTIGYLVTEAESVWLGTATGRVVPGHALAVDAETGFGLVQALGALELPALALGNSDAANVGDPAIVAAGGQRQFISAQIIGKQPFAGYWEYALDEAIFTAPAHPFWGGAGLIGADGKLIGVGSLHVEQRVESGQSRDMNMIVPINLLPPILDELLRFGRRNKPARPWLGVYSAESEGEIVIGDVSERGPASQAGLRRGDVIASVGGTSVADLGEFYRAVWKCGSAGVEIPLEIQRDGRIFTMRVQSADRTTYLKKPRLQ